jgi:cyclopropane fatty-acyl-phospholipid synthase-like methyltransferase
MKRAGIKPGMRLLDAGCGVCGPSLYFASRLDVRIDAITISPVQVELARSRIDASGLSHRVRVSLGDFHRLRDLYASGSFDLVYFLESFCHSHQPRLLATSVFDVLERGGSLYLKDYFSAQHCDPADQACADRILQTSNRVFRCNIPDRREVREIMFESGFREVWSEPPAFEFDLSAWAEFDCLSQFNLAGGERKVDWVNCLEMKLQKPD